MQVQMTDLLPSQVIRYVMDYNKAEALNDETIYIEKRAIRKFTRMTTSGQVKTFQIPLIESDIHV